ncbi:MAG: ATP-binding cassette domain-containing protein, partial [Ilumatobacteraceae bacterium]
MTSELIASATVAGGTGEPKIVMDHVDKWFGSFQALKDITLTVGCQEVVVVIGPSGSGKSTLIRCVNRLEVHDKGSVVVGGVELTRDPRSVATVRK